MEYISQPSINVGGTRIAYVKTVPPSLKSKSRRPFREVWVTDVDGTNQRKFTSAPNNSWAPQWTPDGNLSFLSLRKEHNLLMLLASKTANKAILSLMLTDDLIKKGLDAKNMINIIAKDIEGAGGGQSFFATAGGKNPNGIAKALETIKLLLKDQK